jgi:hypothetical protein
VISWANRTENIDMTESLIGTSPPGAGAERQPTGVDRHHALSAERLEREYLRTSTPVVITGVTSKWPALERWRTPRGFAQRAGSGEVPLITLPDDVAPYYVIHPEVLMPFDRCVALIHEDRLRRHYINQIDLEQYAPHLAEDYAFPYPEIDVDPGRTILWLGSAGCLSQLHFDLGHNFACQVSGTKLFRLFPPQQSHRLYARPDGKRCPISTVEEVDLVKYPSYRAAHYVEVRLTPGDLLFLPGFWWHQVITQEPGVMLTWFANTPEMMRDKQRLEAATGVLGSRDLAKIADLVATFETESYRNFLWAAVARGALELGAPDLALRALAQVTDRRFAEEMADVLPPVRGPGEQSNGGISRCKA